MFDNRNSWCDRSIQNIVSPIKGANETIDESKLLNYLKLEKCKRTLTRNNISKS